MKRITRLSGYAIIPLGILLFLEAWVVSGDSIQESVITSSAALLGMLPKGLVLLISVSLAAGVSRMAKHKVLIQDLYSLETLANVDTLCLDKTGTITTGDLRWKRCFPFAMKRKQIWNIFAPFYTTATITMQPIRRFVRRSVPVRT